MMNISNNLRVVSIILGLLAIFCQCRCNKNYWGLARRSECRLEDPSTLVPVRDTLKRPAFGVILRDGKVICSCTLVGKRLVLTGAHCIKKHIDHKLEVSFGSIDSKFDRYNIESLCIDPKFCRLSAYIRFEPYHKPIRRYMTVLKLTREVDPKQQMMACIEMKNRRNDLNSSIYRAPLITNDLVDNLDHHEVKFKETLRRRGCDEEYEKNLKFYKASIVCYSKPQQQQQTISSQNDSQFGELDKGSGIFYIRRKHLFVSGVLGNPPMSKKSLDEDSDLYADISLSKDTLIGMLDKDEGCIESNSTGHFNHDDNNRDPLCWI